MGSTGYYVGSGFTLKNIENFLLDQCNSDYINDKGQRIEHRSICHTFRFGEFYSASRLSIDGVQECVYALCIKWSYSKGEIIYKDMDETCGPFMYEASATLLKELTPTTNQAAIEWRKANWKKFKKIPKEYQ